MKEIEYIDPKHYLLLNDYIRVGKRLISQHKLLKKIDKEYEYLEEKMYNAFEKYSCDGIFFQTVRRDKRDYLYIGISAIKTRGFEVSFRYCNFFKDAFRHIVDIISDVEIKEKFENIIEEVKKEAALNFFRFKELEDYYWKISDLINAKEKEQSKRFLAIEYVWDKDSFPKAGEPIGYNRGKKWGVLVGEFSPLRVKIETANGRTVEKETYLLTWKNKFSTTELWKDMKTLANDRKVPACWKEKKVDYYRIEENSIDKVL